MDKKILLQDLVDKLSTMENIKKKEAEDFLRNYFKVIEDGLLKDKIVKINGLGTFKLIEVEARSSVDVNTGQTFIIKEHLKLNFIPDVHLRDEINKPFSGFEPIETDLEVSHEPAETKEPKGSKESKLSTSGRASSFAEPIKEPGHTTYMPDIEDSEDDMEELPDSRKKGGKSGGKFLLILLFLLIVGGLTYWAIKSNQDAKKDQSQKMGIVERFKDLFTKDPEILDIEDSIAYPVPQKMDTIAPVVTSTYPDTTRNYPVYVNIVAGSRLTLLALEYYGNKVFWVYIYLDNKDVIDNPNNIPIGTRLRISKPHPVLMDPNNPEAIQRAEGVQYRVQRRFN